MSATRVSTRGRGAVALLSLSLTAVGLTSGVPGAGAASPAIDYACTVEGLTGPFPLPVVLDTDAPGRMAVGQAAQVTMTASAVLKAPQAQEASTAFGATQFDGSWVVNATFGAAAANPTQTLARTQLTDQTIAHDVPFAASSAAFSFVAPSTPGSIDVTAGNLTGTLAFYDGSGAPKGSKTISCTAPPGKPAVIDTINVVATSTTTLTLDKTASQYGQDVTATAKVTTSSGAPDGDVAFSVDGVATKARVGKDGIATLVLPDAGAGSHSVTATFVPRETAAYDGSASPAQTWTVSKVPTRMRIPVTGRTTKVVTRVGVRAKGVFDTVPTGKVRIKVTRIGKAWKKVKVRTLDATGAARAGFGRLRKGRYQVTVVYRGDANHRYLKKMKKFRVTRG